MEERIRLNSSGMPRVSYRFGRLKGFTLVELLVVIGIISLLTSILLSSLNRIRIQTKAVVCTNNLKQLGLAFICYADDYDDYDMPTVGENRTYWWGKIVDDGIDHTKGFVWPYLQSPLKKEGVYECPAQKYGSYGLQGKPADKPDEPKWITSTYGYNGYYLSSPQSGWPETRNRPWQKTTTLMEPSLVIAFADTLIDYDSTGTSPILKNTALLDPPYLYRNNGWEVNRCPTTCFRHNDKTNVVFVDGHSELMGPKDANCPSPKTKIGSVGKSNAPHYVPDYQDWVQVQRRKR
jgi:prepilin-type N-terminal cleavage/methylation domain-containing protein/prepilin-type processing-associated H-X9-DG protein